MAFRQLSVSESTYVCKYRVDKYLVAVYLAAVRYILLFKQQIRWNIYTQVEIKIKRECGERKDEERGVLKNYCQHPGAYFTFLI